MFEENKLILYSRKNSWVLGLLLFLFTIGLVYLPIHTHSLTTDEVGDISVGYAQARYGLYSLDPANPPLIRMIYGTVVALFEPLSYKGPEVEQMDFFYYSRMFFDFNKSSLITLTVISRYVVVGLMLLTGFILFRWVKQLYGITSAYISFFYFILNPNVLAHGTLATLDMGLTFTWLFYGYILHKWIGEPDKKVNTILLGLSLGFCLTAKFTSVILIPLTCLVLLCDRSWIKQFNVKFAFLHSGIFLLSMWMTILAVYRFHNIQYGLPYWFITGIKLQINDAGTYFTYLNGKISQSAPWYYYLEAILLKNPIPFLIVMGWGIFSASKQKLKMSRDVLISLVFIGGLLIVFSLSGKKMLGIRYLLPMYPFIALLIARLFHTQQHWKYRTHIHLLMLIGCLISTLSINPHYLSYFNIIAGGPSKGHRYLLDSNLDWSQDTLRLKEYMYVNNLDSIYFVYSGYLMPEVYGIQTYPLYDDTVKGIVAISVNRLYGIQAASPEYIHQYEWLKNKKYLGRVGYSIWLYDTR